MKGGIILALDAARGTTVQKNASGPTGHTTRRCANQSKNWTPKGRKRRDKADCNGASLTNSKCRTVASVNFLGSFCIKIGEIIMCIFGNSESRVSSEWDSSPRSRSKRVSVTIHGSPAYRSCPDPGSVRSGQVLLIGSSFWMNTSPPIKKGFGHHFDPSLIVCDSMSGLVLCPFPSSHNFYFNSFLNWNIELSVPPFNPNAVASRLLQVRTTTGRPWFVVVSCNRLSPDPGGVRLGAFF